MISQIQEIWQPGQGGPTVGQGPKQTRVAVVTFDTQANVVANLNQFNSNADLISNLQAIRQTSAQIVDGSNALQTAGNLLVAGAVGNRPNAPNVIIFYTADWAGNDPCHVAEFIKENGVVMVILVQSRNGVTPAVPQCVYTPGEVYNATNPNLDVITLTSLSYANCFCVGQGIPGKLGGPLNAKASRDHQVWLQFWLPQIDGIYYLRDKWGECVWEQTTAASNHDDAMNPGDFAYWNPSQPDVSNLQYCVREVPGISGASGYRWSTVPCTGFPLQFRSQYLCQQPACDALNFCSNY
uniref:VWFA domain-containing protein n=1 Tax=Plectus sambesii TaxID=2011161 RepID=A0A914W8I6_9BILA